MSDLARRRSAKDVWVSRSHLQAAAAFFALTTIGSFGAGYLLGAWSVEDSTPRYARLVDEVPGTALVELLAEVERAKVVHATSALQYPEWAASPNGMALPSPESADGAPVVDAAVEAPPLVRLPPVDPAPDGAWTVAIGRFDDPTTADAVKAHLQARGYAAWRSLRLQDGTPEIGVAVGGFESEDEARALMESLASAVSTAPSTLGTPEIAELATW